MRPIFTKFEAKLIRVEALLHDCKDALDLEFFKNQLLNPTIHNYNEQLRLSNKTVEEQEAYNRITTKLNLLKANYLEKKKLLTEEENGTYLIGKNFILGPQGLVDELPKAKIDRNPPLPQKAIQALEEKDKVSLLEFLYQFCEEKFARKEPPGFVSLKMIDALWEMGTRGHELADLLKKALPDYNKPGNQLSEARYIALKNTTALIYQKFWHSGDSSIERYALEGFDRQYISGFNEKNFSFTRPNPLLSTKNISSKISENESLLFNRRGHLRKIISDAILDPKAEDSRMTPTVYVTNKDVWVDESSQSQEMRCFGTQGRFWKRWQKCKEEQACRYLVINSGTSQSPEFTRQRDRYACGALAALRPFNFKSPTGLKINTTTMADAFSDALYFSYGKTSGLRLPGTTRLGVPPSLARSE